jgi:hypothetical protein
LVRIEQGLALIEAAQQRPAGLIRERPERYLRVLVDVYDRGGRRA